MPKLDDRSQRNSHRVRAMRENTARCCVLHSRKANLRGSPSTLVARHIDGVKASNGVWAAVVGHQYLLSPLLCRMHRGASICSPQTALGTLANCHLHPTSRAVLYCLYCTSFYLFFSCVDNTAFHQRCSNLSVSSQTKTAQKEQCRIYFSLPESFKQPTIKIQNETFVEDDQQMFFPEGDIYAAELPLLRQAVK